MARRITGLRPGAFLRQKITGPQGIDVTSGLPESETHRLAELVRERPDRVARAALLDRMTPVAAASLLNPPTGRAAADTPAWRAAEIPAANGHGTPARTRARSATTARAVPAARPTRMRPSPSDTS